MQNNQQITSVSQKNDQQSRPGAEHEESVQSQSISSQSTPGQQTAFCDLSARQENEFLSKGSSIRRFVKNPNAKRPFAVDSFATTTPPDPNNNNEGAKVRSGGESPVSRVAAEHQPVYRSLSMEPAGAAQAANLPEDLVAENLQQQATAGQANSLPTIQLSSEAEHDQENASQLPVKLNYRKSSDSTHKRTKSATKKATRNLLLNKEKLEEVNSKINRTRSFNTPKKHTKSSAALAKSHVSKHNQTSSRSSSIDSNLHIQVTDSSPKTIQQQLERQFEKRARSKESRCKHHRHRKSSARQLQYPDGHAAAVSPVAGLLSYSRSTEDVRGCNCSHSELPPAVYLSNNGALVYTSGCFSSTSALAVDSFASAAGLQLHHSPISANASLVPTSFLLLPDSSVCKNVSLSPSPTYFSSYSAVPSYQTTPVHKHKHRSSSKGTKSSKKAAVSPIPDYLAVDFLEGRLTKSNSVRLSRADSKGKCSKEHRCRKCRRKTSLNSSLRGQANYAEVADGAGKHYALPTAYSPGSQLQNAGKSSSSSGGGGSGFAQPAMHMTDPLAGAVTNPILLHNPLHLHSVVHSAAAHDPITKTSSLNPAALGHIVSPVHLCQLNNALLANNLAATAGGLTPVNPLLGQLSQLTNTPSTLSVPDLSRLALNVTTATQPIQLQYTHMHPIPTTVSQQPTGDAKVSEAFTKLYRNKPAPDYFSNLFSAKPDNDRSNEKPKLLDFLLTGADDLGKFLSKSSQLDNESFSLDKNLKADANRKSSSTESLNLKTTTNATSTLTTSTTTTTILNDALKQPAVIRKNFFKEKQKGAADVKQPEKQAETANDKEANDKRQSEPNSTKGATDQDRSRPGLASGTSVASEDQSEQDKVPSKPLMEKRKTSNRHPMLNLLRKAQQTAEADAPPSFEPANSLTPNDGVQDSNKAVSRLAAVVDAEKPDHPNAVTDRTKQEVVKVEIECNKTKAKFITKQSSTERSTVASEPAVVASSEIVMHSEQPEQQPARSRPFLMRMLASRKETKQLPTTSKSLEQPSVKASIKKAAEHHTVDIPTQEEIAESTDELRALRTNLKKSGSITNGSKIGTLTRGAPKSSPSKEETGAATSTMAKLRKKVRFCYFLIYECAQHSLHPPRRNSGNYGFEFSAGLPFRLLKTRSHLRHTIIVYCLKLFSRIRRRIGYRWCW